MKNMKDHFKRLLMIIIFAYGSLLAQRFTAYYHKVDDDYDVTGMVDDKLFGKYADLFVELYDKGIIQFTRQTSYLPVWKTDTAEHIFEEIIPRSGDGQGKRPDIISKYSHVRLIKNTADEIHIHWRYFPDFNHVQWDGVVNEYYIIKSDGKVFRSIKKGTKKYTDWINSNNKITRVYQLSANGIEQLCEETPETEYNYDFKAIDTPVFKSESNNKKLQFSFDEGTFGYSDKTSESISNKEY